ncbi:MAG: L-threonylcarbamoyladenylate synthase [Desulfobulbus sp.]
MGTGPSLIEPVGEAALMRAVRLLQAGGVVAFPTETYYGLAVDPFNAQALERLFVLKARSQAKPVLVLVQDTAQIPLLAAQSPPVYTQLIRFFWPGPLTLVFPARTSLPHQLTARTRGIGLRQSPHPVAAKLLAAFGGPLTATSANRSGTEPATSAQQAASLVQGALGFVLDGGETPGGAGSTVVGLHAGILHCLRPGKIPFAEVEAVARRG